MKRWSHKCEKINNKENVLLWPGKEGDAGIDIGLYPSAKTYLVGVSLTF